MKTLVTLSASALLGLALAAPAAACDRHGAGYGGFYGGNWKSYNPRVSNIDPAMDENLLSLMEVPVEAPQAAPQKPTFSSFASRASERALSRRAEAKAKAEDKASEDGVKSAALKTAVSDTDR